MCLAMAMVQAVGQVQLSSIRHEAQKPPAQSSLGSRLQICDQRLRRQWYQAAAAAGQVHVDVDVCHAQNSTSCQKGQDFRGDME